MFAQFRIDRVEGELAIVEQHEPARREGGDLPRELGPDRPPGAGHENPAARDQPRHAVAVEHCLRASEQILEGDRLDDTFGAREVAAKIGEFRQARQRDRQRVGAFEQRSHLRAGEVLRGDDQFLRTSAPAIEPRDDVLERLDRAEHRNAIDLSADPRGGGSSVPEGRVEPVEPAQQAGPLE